MGGRRSRPPTTSLRFLRPGARGLWPARERTVHPQTWDWAGARTLPRGCGSRPRGRTWRLPCGRGRSLEVGSESEPGALMSPRGCEGPGARLGGSLRYAAGAGEREAGGWVHFPREAGGAAGGEAVVAGQPGHRSAGTCLARRRVRLRQWSRTPARLSQLQSCGAERRPTLSWRRGSGARLGAPRVARGRRVWRRRAARSHSATLRSCPLSPSIWRSRVLPSRARAVPCARSFPDGEPNGKGPELRGAAAICSRAAPRVSAAPCGRRSLRLSPSRASAPRD